MLYYHLARIWPIVAETRSWGTLRLIVFNNTFISVYSVEVTIILETSVSIGTISEPLMTIPNSAMTMCSPAAVYTDLVSAVYRGPKKKFEN
jgi:hypothetical protein